jgi:hypothetical protein
MVLEYIALAVLRWTEPDLVRPFQVPGGKTGAIICGILPTALLLVASVFCEHTGLAIGIGTILAGFVTYWGIIALQSKTQAV